MPVQGSRSAHLQRAQRAAPSRSESIFGRLKRVVSASLSLLGAAPEGEDFEAEAGQNGKRQRVAPDAGTVSHVASMKVGKGVRGADFEPKAKRQRVRSPEPGYNDPPMSMFPSSLSRRTANGGVARTTASQATVLEPRSSAPSSPSPVRETTVTSNDGADRQPPSNIFLRASTWTHPAPAPPAPGPIARDYSMPPPPSAGMRAPFRMRGSHSLTPQPSGQAYGPNVYHRERGGSAQPPALADLMANPTFLHPPTDDMNMRGATPGGHRRSMSVQRTITLGDIAESRGSSPMRASPLRQQSTFIIDPQASGYESSSAREYTPVHTAADTLNDLDAYKTPLLPTRLRMASSAVGEGSTSVIPDMLRYNKVKAPAPSRKRRGEKDEDLLLGLRRKKGAEKQAKDNENTPYAGKAGYKKLLARGKVPGDEVDDDVAPTAEVRDTMEEDMPVQEPVKGANLGEKATPAAVPTHEDESEPRDPFDLPPAEVPFAPAVFNPTVAAAGSVGPSSLRVGRSKTGRNHNSVQIARTPIRPSPKTGGARFTAVIEDDDESMDAPEGDEPLKPLYTPPAGFSFGSPAQAAQEATKAEEKVKTSDAPVSALPFSLGARPTPVSAFAAPAIALVPSTPEASKEAVKSATSSGVPNFFANSKFLKETPPAAPSPVPAATTSVFGKEPSVSLFGSPAKPAQPPASQDVASSLDKASGRPQPASIFGAAQTETAKTTPSVPSSLFGQKVDTPVVSAPPATFSFGGPAATAKVVDNTLGTPFSFGDAPAAAKSTLNQVKGVEAQEGPAANPSTRPPPEVTIPTAATTALPSSASAPVAEAPKPAFTFDTPSVTTTTAGTPSADSNAPKLPFGAPTAPFSFGQPAKSVEEPKSGATTAPFSFGQSAKPSEHPKQDAAKTPFSFGAAPATPPAVPETTKSPFSFATPAAPVTPAPIASAPSGSSSGSGFSFSLGAPALGTTIEAPKPFAFGGPAAAASPVSARPVTPPKKDDDEIQMDESPSRSGSSMDLYSNSQPSKPASTSFSFGSGAPSGSALFGSTPAPASSPFSFGASNSPSAASTNGFSFGQKQDTPASSSGFSFGAKPDPAAASPSTFSFGQKLDTPTSSPGPFSFGQKTDTPAAGSGFSFGKKADSPAPAAFSFGQKTDAPTSPAGFSFGSKPTPAPALTTSFSTGSQSSATPFSFTGPASAPPVSTPQFTFGGPAAGAPSGFPASNPGSAPGTPRLPHTNPFGFNTPAPATPSSPFAFGGGSSQPASPAVANPGLPGVGSPFSFGGGPVIGTPPPSSHGASQSLGAGAAAGGGQPMFTMGAAPQQPAGGPRAIKKLPGRRKK